VNAWLETLTTTGAFWLSASLAAAACAATLDLGHRRGSTGPAPPLGTAFQVPGRLRGPMAAAGLFGIGYGAFLQFLPLLAERRAIPSAGLGYAVYGVGIVLTRLITGRWQDRADRRPLLRAAFLILAAGLCVLAVSGSQATFLLGTGLIALGSGGLHPGLIATHLELMPEAQRARSVACFYLAFDLGIGAGTWLLTPAFQYLGLQGLYLTAAALTACGIAVVRWRPA